MRTSADGIAMLHHVEQLRLKAYPDPATGGAPWTIGYGHTGPDVYPGLVWTPEQAEAAFERRLREEFEPAVTRALTVETAQCEFDAIVCWAYNVGVGNMRSSTLMRLHNAGQRDKAAEQFRVWKFAGGKDCTVRSNNCYGIIRRREMERARYLGVTGAEAIAIYEATK